MSVHFRFYSEEKNRIFVCEDLPLLWGILKTLMEQKYFCVQSRKNKNLGSFVDSTLLGFREENIPLQETDLIQKGDRIVLKRFPIPKEQLYSYNKHNQKTIDSFFINDPYDQMDEHERLMQLISQGGEQPILQRSIRPNPKYTCYCCGTMGQHFRIDCPKNSDSSWIPLSKRKLPSGIPMTRFRKATQNEQATAYIDIQGNYWSLHTPLTN